jgi:acetyl-CoA acetyltransferase
MKDIVIVSGKRTPMGEYGGALHDFSALEPGAIAACIGGGQGIAMVLEAL